MKKRRDTGGYTPCTVYLKRIFVKKWSKVAL